MEITEVTKYFSKENIISLFVSLFPNKKILDNFSESSNGDLLYNGKKIIDSKLNGVNPLEKTSYDSLVINSNISLEKNNIILENNNCLIKTSYNGNHLLSSISEIYSKIETEE